MMNHQQQKSPRGAQRPFRFYIASLGCPKNTVDSNAMGLLLQRAGYEATLDPYEADVLIVNTCGFIELARQESFETLQALAAQTRPEQRLIAAGCWAQRSPDWLLDAVPSLDAVIGTRTWPGIEPLVEQLLSEDEDERSIYELVQERPFMLPEEADVPGYVISGPSAFLKIADGCSRQCAFCAIPGIKGAAVSRPMDAVLEDARQLQELGLLEMNLIAQDATAYGLDRGIEDGLAKLLEQLVAEVPDLPWIRILYTFPGFITPRLVDTIAQHKQILNYIDIPLQHAHPDVLRRMRRPADVEGVRRMIADLRARIPDVAIRTAMIVGFPGETDEEFRALLDFVNEMRFDRMGVFTYSEEVGTPAADLEDDVPPEVKEERYEALMVAQQSISHKKNLSFVGERMEVLLEGTGDDLTVGRSYRDAPEIDGMVLVREELPTYRLVTVEVTDAMVYDLIGRVAPPNEAK